MWGFGCILSELTFLRSKVDVPNGEKILFISKKEKENPENDPDDFTLAAIDDHLELIFDTLGPQSDTDLSFISD